jgi:hypothetical protein
VNNRVRVTSIDCIWYRSAVMRIVSTLPSCTAYLFKAICTHTTWSVYGSLIAPEVGSLMRQFLTQHFLALRGH